MSIKQNRRVVIKNLIAGSVAMGSSSLLTACAADTKNDKKEMKLKGNINHSVCQWCYNFISLEELCKAVKEIGDNVVGIQGDVSDNVDLDRLYEFGESDHEIDVFGVGTEIVSSHKQAVTQMLSCSSCDQRNKTQPFPKQFLCCYLLFVFHLCCFLPLLFKTTLFL